MSFSNYKGSLELGAGLTPSGEGYPLMQTCDIMAAEDGTRLDVLLANMASNLGVNIDGELAEQARLIQEIRASLEDKSGVGRICIQDGYWYIDGENTGVKAVAEDGKSAYSYAVSAGYTGTETEFAEMLAGDDSSMIGTWVLCDSPFNGTLPKNSELFFTSNGVEYSTISVRRLESETLLCYERNEDSHFVVAYANNPTGEGTTPHGWKEGFNTINITKEPDDGMANWVRANGEKEGRQQTADARLKTKSKRIVDAINELSDQIADGVANGLEIVTTTGTSSAYEATVTGITELKSGVSFVMIPHITNTGISTLKVNDFDALPIWRNTSNGGSSLLFSNILISGKPTTVMYYETDSLKLWLLTDMTQPLADDLSGIVPIVNGGVPATSAANKGKVLTTNSIGFPEWADPTGGEIDASDLATVDKVKHIDTWWYGRDSIDYDNAGGITWLEGFAFADTEGNTLSSGSITQQIPIVAGKNISFEIDYDNYAVKINAKGGGSADNSVKYSEGLDYSPYGDGLAVIGIGTCTDRDVLIPPEHDGLPVVCIQDYAFYVGADIDSIYIPASVIDGMYDALPDDITVYCEAETQPDGWYPDWNYNDNPVVWGYKLEIGGSNSGSGFEMPQIRFTSANGSDMNGDTTTFFVDEQNPLKLTVEIVGGGDLKVGDALQVCVRKRFNGSMANGNRKKYKLQRFAEYVVTEDDLNKRYLTVYIECGTEDNKVAYRGLFRDGNTQDLSPLYLRIRRPKGGMQANDSGQTVDAEFSNIVTIWKHFHRGNQLIRIY